MIRKYLLKPLVLWAVLLGFLLNTPSWCGATPASTPPLFALHDGDTVVFYGDSITEQLAYGRDIEAFVDTRLPRMHVKFINSGWGGDMVWGGGGGSIELRLKRDVINYKPSVVTVFLGMNDGGYAPYSETRFQAYAVGLTHIVDELTRALPHARLFLLTPSFFDDNAKARPPLPATPDGYGYNNPAPDYNQTLLRYGAFVKKLGAQHHIPVVDVNAPMAATVAAGRKTDPKYAISGDGVHPGELGHLIIAAAVLTAWHAPLMPAVALTPGTAKAKIYPLPWPLHPEGQAGLALVPQAARLCAWNAFLPGFNGNAQQPYHLLMDGQTIGTFTGEQLLQGIDLTQYPTLPQNQQAQRVLTLVRQRADTWHDFWKGSAGLVHANDVPTAAELAQLRAENIRQDALRSGIHAAAQPVPHTFQLQPAAPAQPQATNAQTR